MKTKRRIFHVGLLFFLGFLVFIGRLVQIQLIATTSFSDENINLIRASVAQRTDTFILNEGRGQLLDRNGDLLPGANSYALILFPYLKEANWPLEKMAEMIDVSPDQLKKAIQKADAPFRFTFPKGKELSAQEAEKIRKLAIPGVFAVPAYSPEEITFARHLIGVVSENPELVKKRYPERWEEGRVNAETEVGVMGLQEAFDPFLLSRGSSVLVYQSELSGSPLFGLRIRYRSPDGPYYPLRVKTTIATDLQKIVEKAINRNNLEKGAVVLLDVKTNNLLAMASRPLFDPEEPFGKGGKNHAILPHIPGSVFKIVTAARAIAAGYVDDGRTYNCDLSLYGDKPAQRQLGRLSFAESFYMSCNYAFGQIANELRARFPGYLYNDARRLGLIGPSGWVGDVFRIRDLHHFPNEVKGRVWLNGGKGAGKRAVAQTAIGQLNVRVSPLAVANTMATIARGGVRMTVRSATEVQYQNGLTLTRFPRQIVDENVFPPYTMNELAKLLRGVVRHPRGTGHRWLFDLPYPVAGKSGTAEHGEKATSSQWFAGYFPANRPQYALVVVDLQHQDGEAKTYRIYREIVQEIYRYHH